MKDNTLYQSFVDVIKNKIPQRGLLTNRISDILALEKEAVYRRLRGDVSFSFSEIALLSIEFGISLDSIAEKSSPMERPLIIRFVNFFNPSELDCKMFEGSLNGARALAEDPDSEYGAISALIPSPFNVAYKAIYKFYMLKYLHQFGQGKKQIVYKDVKINDRLSECNKKFVILAKKAANSLFILNEKLIEILVKDLNYFYEARLLAKENIVRIKDDINMFLNDLERYTNAGSFISGGKVQVYISNLQFDTNYSYFDAENYRMTLMRAFSLNDAYSFDEKVFLNMKKWTQFLKRTSTLISESDELQRVVFFEKQRDALKLLCC